MPSAAENKILMIVLAVLIPPLAVGLKDGFGLHLVINIVLCLIFYVPGLIHALWRVLK